MGSFSESKSQSEDGERVLPEASKKDLGRPLSMSQIDVEAHDLSLGRIDHNAPIGSKIQIQLIGVIPDIDRREIGFGLKG